MSAAYDNYIREHLENLKNGLEWIQQNLSGPFIDGEALTDAILNAQEHDRSKYDKEEYDAYDAYFYGPEKTPEVQSAFDYAWLHHIHNNPHHWQYWVLMEDDLELGEFGKVLDMPLNYIYEMIADWWTFSWRSSNLMEIFGWYESHRDTIKLSVKTRMIVEQILSAMFKVLSMQLILSGKGEDVKTYIFMSEIDEFAHRMIAKEEERNGIDDIPVADVRPVVLCKDCRHRDPEDHKCDSGETERQGCPFKVADDYFCAYGER